MAHRDSRKRKTAKPKKKHTTHSVYDIIHKLYLQVMQWILSIFGICQSACLKVGENIAESNITEHLKNMADRFQTGPHDSTSSSTSTSTTSHNDKCIKFAFFDVVDTETGTSVKLLPYTCGIKRYWDIWFDLSRCYGFKNPILGLTCLILYPFISMYVLAWLPWIFWSMIWYQISWWFYTLCLSLVLLAVTIPLYMLCLIVGVMVICSTWIPILGAMLGIGGLGPAYCRGGLGGCPFMPVQIYWADMCSYICCPPLLSLWKMKVCKNDADCDYDNCDDYDCDCCKKPTTTTPPTTEPPTTTEAPVLP